MERFYYQMADNDYMRRNLVYHDNIRTYDSNAGN